MDDLKGKVAVITGGASGMGLAFAHRFAAAGMRLAVADIEAPTLDSAVAELIEVGADAIGFQCDVSDADSMQDLASSVYDTFGTAHVVCLNAGVAAVGTMAELKLADWQWVLGVNLWGVIHGVDAFLKQLITQDEGHLVVTASVCGHTCYPTAGPYNATKHAVTAIAETLYNELSADGSKVGVTALCPGFVDTQIVNSGRNRPEHLLDANNEALTLSVDEQRERDAILEEFSAVAVRPSYVAELVHAAILDNTFWVFTDDRHSENIKRRQLEIRERRNPSERLPMLEEAFGVATPPLSPADHSSG
ncbi:MAG: SDR family NAD(P)-dependent oxidoreductase [Acidimicrobiales bacterium]|nr:SDR family NAD(P)-dependent oxidoreductase [Acidimicrobiales bacterium]